MADLRHIATPSAASEEGDDHRSVCLTALFTQGNDNVFLTDSVPNDGAGLSGFDEGINIEFASPLRWIAIEIPGVAQFALYQGDDLMYTSGGFGGRKWLLCGARG